VKAIDAGFFQDEIGRSAYDHQMAVEHGARVVVGVNKYDDGQPVPIIPAPDYRALEAGQVARVRAAREKRDARRVAAALEALKAAAPGAGAADSRVMPCILDAVRARATVGEISDTFEAVYGRYRAS